MSEQTIDTPPQAPKRRNKVAEEKARLRAELDALVNKVPPAVNAGSIQTTREWIDTNTTAGRAAKRKRVSRFALLAQVEAMKAWASKEPAT
jgi:hypothetical protein